MNVLHLEDDGPLREILAVALKAVEPKCDLHQFTFSDDAVSYASSHAQDIDLFILDIRVPGTMNGLDVAHKVREIGCPGTLVLTSAYQTPEQTLLQGLKAEWFPKPWHIVETCVKLLEIVRTKQAIASQTPALPALPTTESTSKPVMPPASPTIESAPKPVIPPSELIVKTLSSPKPAEDDADKPKPSA